ncbi:MAG: MipA/OmpV family protein [Rhizobiaceae bacterium]
MDALKSLAVLIVVGSVSASAAAAQEGVDDSQIDLVIELGFGGRAQPSYEGSDDYEISPFPVIGFGYLNLPGLFTIGSLEPSSGGLSFGPAFNYISDRDFDRDADLQGLNDVDATFEAGLRVGYEWKNAEVWGEARYAFGGAEGLVGELGVNAIARPTNALELRAGPFASFASDGYTDTYFGVTDEESAATGGSVGSFNPSGGFKSVGVKAIARYEFRPNWFLNADASYAKLVGDAADSPIVVAGDEAQFTFGLGISRKFSLDLF